MTKMAIINNNIYNNKNNNKLNNKKIASLIWVFSAILFYIIFQFLFQNSTSYSLSSDVSVSNTEQRSRLYSKMAKDLDEHGASFLKHGETSQSLSLSDLFSLNDGFVKPIFKAAKPPVRANVLYLNPEYSIPISNAVKNIFLPYFDKSIVNIESFLSIAFYRNKSVQPLHQALLCLAWFQNSTMYHFSMFHASHHISPVSATKDEVEAEAKAVKAVTEGLCPLKIELDRVVLTSTGVLLGCWQVISGTDPITVRAKLRKALPHAPEKQLYDAAILHTSFARLRGHPTPVVSGENKTSEMEIFRDLVKRLNNQIHRFQAIVLELWYVEEFDVLALALDGKMKVRKFRLGCSKT